MEISVIFTIPSDPKHIVMGNSTVPIILVGTNNRRTTNCFDDYDTLTMLPSSCLNISVIPYDDKVCSTKQVLSETELISRWVKSEKKES